MPITLTVEAAGAGWLHDAEEWLPGTIDTIEEAEGRFGKQLKWVINLDGDDPNDDGTLRGVWAYSGARCVPRSKLHGWLKALGLDLDGDEVELGPLLGSRVDVFYERYTGTSLEGQPVEKERIVKMRASKTPAPTTTKPAARRVVADDDDAPF